MKIGYSATNFQLIFIENTDFLCYNINSAIKYR